MRTLRDEVLAAFDRLESRTGQPAQRLKDVVASVLQHAPHFSEQAVRTYVVSVMCADAPVHHANHTNDLRRIDRGLYARADRWGSTRDPSADPIHPARGSRTAKPLEPKGFVQGSDWFWEGNVQAAAVAGLAAEGWRIRSVADTASRAPGTDIVADKGGKTIHLEIKGYPSDRYARGRNQGERKPTQPATQARVWFAGALLKAAMLRNDYPDDLVVIGLPSFGTYRGLTERVSDTLSSARIGVVWIQESGEVRWHEPRSDL